MNRRRPARSRPRMQHPYLQAARRDRRRAGALAAPTSSGSTRADKYAWILEVTRRAARLSSTFGSVPRVTKPTQRGVPRAVLLAEPPVRDRGRDGRLAALAKWNADYLKAGAAATLTVAVEVYRDADAGSQVNPRRSSHEMNFGEFVDAVESGVETNGLVHDGRHHRDNARCSRTCGPTSPIPDTSTPTTRSATGSSGTARPARSRRSTTT